MLEVFRGRRGEWRNSVMASCGRRYDGESPPRVPRAVVGDSISGLHPGVKMGGC